MQPLKKSKEKKEISSYSSFILLIIVLTFIIGIVFILFTASSLKASYTTDLSGITSTTDFYTYYYSDIRLGVQQYLDRNLGEMFYPDVEYSNIIEYGANYGKNLDTGVYCETGSKPKEYSTRFSGVNGDFQSGGTGSSIYSCKDNTLHLTTNWGTGTNVYLLLYIFEYEEFDTSRTEDLAFIILADQNTQMVHVLDPDLMTVTPTEPDPIIPEIRFKDGKGGRYATTTTQWDYELFIPESYDGWAGSPYAYNSTTTIYSGLSFRFINLDSDTWVNSTTTTYKRETIVWTDPFRFFDPVYEPTYGEWDGYYTFSIYDDGVYKIDPPYEYYSPEQLAEGVYAVEMCFVVNLDANISCETIYNESEYDFQNRICSLIDEGYSFNSCGWYPYNDFSLGCEPSTSIQYPVDHVTCSYDFIMIGTSTTYDEDDFNDLTANPEYYMSSSQFDDLSTRSESLDFCQNPDNVVTRALCGLYNLGFTRLEKMLAPSPTVMDQLFTDIWSNLKTSVPLGYVTRLVYIFTTDDIATSTVPTLAFTFTKSFPDDLVGEEIEFDVFGTSSFAFLNQVKSDSSAETPFWDIFMDYFNLFLAVSLFAVIIKDILGIDLGKDSDDSGGSVQVISQGKRHRVKKSEINWSNVKVKN